MSSAGDQPDLETPSKADGDIKPPTLVEEESITPPDYPLPANTTKHSSEKRLTKKQLEIDKITLEVKFLEASQPLELDLLSGKKRTQELDNTNINLENWRYAIDLGLRLVTAVAVPVLVVYWLSRVLSIVTTQQTMLHNEGLSETSIVALLGTTSITVVGMMGIVVRYLFTQPIARTKLPNSDHSNPINY